MQTTVDTGSNRTLVKASLDPGTLLHRLANRRSGIVILGKDIPIFLQLLGPENARKNIKYIYKGKRAGVSEGGRSL